jgi:hypothetical protein
MPRVLVYGDLTGWATVGLGVATLIVAIATGISVYFTRKALTQGQSEIALNRGEVVQAHRPVLVPRAYKTVFDTYQQPDADHPTAALIRIGLQNIGAGPALDVTATIQMCEADGSLTAGWGSAEFSGTFPGIGVTLDRAIPITVARLTDLRCFSVVVSYKDVAGMPWTTSARFLTEQAANGDKRYIKVEFSDPPTLVRTTPTSV